MRPRRRRRPPLRTAPALLLAALAVGTASSTRLDHRRLLQDESVSDALRSERARGSRRPSFTLVALVPDGPPGDGVGGVGTVEVDVVEATPSVTPRTTYSVRGGPSRPVGDLALRFLVSSGRRKEGGGGGGGEGELTILAVEEDTGRLSGMGTDGAGRTVSYNQGRDSPVLTATEAERYSDPDWSCTVAHAGGRAGTAGVARGEGGAESAEAVHGMEEAASADPNPGGLKVGEPGDDAGRPGLFLDPGSRGGDGGGRRLEPRAAGHEHPHDHSHGHHSHGHSHDGHSHDHSHDHHSHQDPGRSLTSLLRGMAANRGLSATTASDTRRVYPTDNFPKM